jgi:hypothetical protein
MSKLRVQGFSISLDGCGAGSNQNTDDPLGIGGEALHEWILASRTWQRMYGRDGGETGLDDEFAACGETNVGAWIIGRNMFGPLRDPWPDETRRVTPPYRHRYSATWLSMYRTYSVCGRPTCDALQRVMATYRGDNTCTLPAVISWRNESHPCKESRRHLPACPTVHGYRRS